jgi:hypothetical protein
MKGKDQPEFQISVPEKAQDEARRIHVLWYRPSGRAPFRIPDVQGFACLGWTPGLRMESHQGPKSRHVAQS